MLIPSGSSLYGLWLGSNASGSSLWSVVARFDDLVNSRRCDIHAHEAHNLLKIGGVMPFDDVMLIEASAYHMLLRCL